MKAGLTTSGNLGKEERNIFCPNVLTSRCLPSIRLAQREFLSHKSVAAVEVLERRVLEELDLTRGLLLAVRMLLEQ